MLIAVTCCPGLALAQASATPAEQMTAESAPAAPAEWYGWQPLVADLVSLSLVPLGIVVGASSGSAGGAIALVSIGMAGLWIAAPAIHLAHDNPWALGSFLIRTAAVGLVVGGTVVTAACFGGSCIAGPTMFGIGATAIVGMIAADAILGRERDEPPPRVSLAPWGDPHARAGGLTLAASW